VGSHDPNSQPVSLVIQLVGLAILSPRLGIQQKLTSFLRLDIHMIGSLERFICEQDAARFYAFLSHFELSSFQS